MLTSVSLADDFEAIRCVIFNQSTNKKRFKVLTNKELKAKTLELENGNSERKINLSSVE